MKTSLLIGVLLLVMGGCSLTTSHVVQERLARVPRMTCAELDRDGPPVDGQATLTDVRPCSMGFVAARSDGDLDLYIPAYPAGLAREPEPADLAFLLQIWDDRDRLRLLDQPEPVEFTCWVTKRARIVEFRRGPGQLEQWARTGLEVKYPGIKLANVWVLTLGHGSTPTAERVVSAWRYGVGELVLGAAVLILGPILARRQSRRGA